MGGGEGGDDYSRYAFVYAILPYHSLSVFCFSYAVSVMLLPLFSLPSFKLRCLTVEFSGCWCELYSGMFSLLVFTAFCACYDAFVFIMSRCCFE